LSRRADLIDACGERFARLWVTTSIWTGESNRPPRVARGGSAEEAMAKLWLAFHRVETGGTA
jgi:hypothetical protein